MTASWTSNRHVLVLFIAMVVAAYHMLQLEQRRAHRDVRVDVAFDRAVGLLRTHLAYHERGNYHVLITQRHSASFASSTSTSDASTRSLAALVVNRAPPIPQIEAELLVDLTATAKQSKSSARQTAASKSRVAPSTPPRHQKPQNHVMPLLKLIVYDATSMATAATQLEQRGLAHIVHHRGSPMK